MFAKESKSGKGGIIFTLLLAIVIFLTVYFSCAGGANFKTDVPDLDTIDGLLSTSLPLPNDGSRPDEHEPNKNAYYAFTSMAQEKNFESFTEGEAITQVAFANVSQKIKAHRVVSGKEVYKESLSHSSFKGVGMRTFVSGNNYVVWEADKLNSIDSVSWKSEASKVSKESYVSMFGYVPNAYTPYIMTDETILSSEYLGEENGIYSFRYDLDTEEATTKISLEMRTMAGTKSLPLFEKVSLIVRMDENWRIREISTDCVYQVDMLGGVTCNESITEVFSDYSEDAVIPNVDFLRSYLDAETTEPLPEELSPTDYLLNGFGEYLTGDKPLRVNIRATGNESLPLALNGSAEIHISLEDLSALSVRANIESIAYGDLSLSNLFIGYESGTAYVKIGDLKAYGSIEEITTIINRLLPLFSTPTPVAVAEETGGGALDFASLLSGATIARENGVATVSLPIELGDISINASILFNEGETISLAGANIEAFGISVEITPDDSLAIDEIGDGYHNIAPLFNIIDENGNLPLEIAIGEEINVLANIHLADMSVDVSLGDLQAKFAQNTLFVKYGELQVKLPIDDISSIVDKLSPILAGKVTLPDFNALVQSIDVMALLTQAVESLETTEENNVLTISTGVDGVALAIRLNITEAGYTVGGIDVVIDEFPIIVSPATEEIPVIATESLGEYYNIVTLLDIIDENNEINLQATIDELIVDVNINLETLVILAKTEIFGETLLVKFADNIVYVSYKGLNISADINEIDTVMDKLAPIVGEIDLSALEDINVEEIISGIVITDDENGLNISAELFGLNANILLDTTDNNLHIASISVVIDELTASVVPCEKANYDFPEANYYNILTLLDIIDENNEINLQATIDELIVDVNINLETLVILAKTEIFGETLLVKFADNIVYVSYKGLNISADINELDTVMNKLAPIIGEIDLSALEDINVEDIISGIVISDNENGLNISAELFGLNANILLDTTDNNLHIANISVVIDELTANVVPCEKASYDFPEANYYNILTLLDIIDENNEINLQATVDSLVVDVNINLETLVILAKTEIFGETLLVKFADNIVFVSYKGLNISADINEIDTVMDKLAPIVGEIDLSALEDINVEEIISGIVITDNENGLNISAELFGLNANILLDTTDNNLHIANISVVIDELTANVVPCDKASYNFPETNYYNILTLLDIIDENNEINLQATIDELIVDVNINLETLVILAKTEIFNETLLVKFADNIVYVSYKGLNISADINDIDTVMDKLAPIVGEIDLSALEDINVEEIISGIVITDDENGLNISAELFGLNANILLDTTDNNLHIASISVVIDELTANVVPCDKASYDFPEANYYNILTLLDIIDEHNEINLQATVDSLVVDVNINLETLVILAKTEIFNETLLIKFADNIVYVSYKGLNISADINDIDTVMDKLAPIIGEIDLSALEDINVEEIISGIVISDNENGLNISAELFGLNANILLDTTDNNLHIASISVAIDELTASVVPCDKASYDFPEANYYNIITLLDIIDENNEINLQATVDSLVVDVNINLETLVILAKTEIFGETLLVKFADNIVYVSYKGLNISADINEIDTVMDKLAPIIGEINLSALEDINVEEIISGIVITDDENGLNISAELFGLNANILLDTTDNNLHIASISVVIDELTANVVPCDKASYDFPEANYYNILTLLDIIDENNEINLQATVDSLVVDVNINLETLVILAKTEIFGETLLIKFADNIVYVSYKGLNISADINEIDTVMDKLAPIVGEIDLSALEDINVEEIISGIVITDDENGLNISAELFGLNANILLDTTDNNLHIASISVVIDELTASVLPCDKASYDFPAANYYNILTLLDIIDDNGYISLSVDLDGTQILATLDLNTMSLYATVADAEIYANLKSGDLYARYPGVQATVNFDDIDGIIEKLKPLIDKLAGENALGDMDLGNLETLDVEELISSIVVTETDSKLSISLEISGIAITLNCAMTDGNLTFDNASVLIGEMEAVATLASEPYIPYFNTDDTYIDLKDLVDTFDGVLNDMFTSDELAVTLGGTIQSTNKETNAVTTITLTANIEIKSLLSAPQGKAELLVGIDNGAGEVTNHKIFLLYNDPSLVTEGSPNVFFYYNDMSNESDKFEGSFTTTKIDETLDILKNIYKNMPELSDALSFIFVRGEDGYPTIPESSIDIATLINSITLADGTLRADLNGTAFMDNLPMSIMATLSAPNDVLTLCLPSLAMDNLSVNNLTITLNQPETAFDGNTFVYTPTGKVNDFSSINELLSALETTSRSRSFSITGKVSMKALSILDFTDKATLTAKLEIINNKTYAVVNLARESVSMLGISVWNDYDGNATLYFDPEEQMIYIKDVSRTRKLTWTGYKYTTTTTYKKYTVDEFMENIKTILFDMLHFSSTIRKELDKPSDHVSTATIENTFLGYSYANNTFSIDLDLEPLIGDIQEIHLDIGHDSDMNIKTLYAKMNVVSVLEVKLNASLTTHADHAQKLDGVIASERSSSNY